MSKIDLSKYERVYTKPCRKSWTLGGYDILQETYMLGKLNSAQKTTYCVYEGITTNYSIKNGKEPIAAFSTRKEAEAYIEALG
jgi:hypothetical protein